LTSDEYAAKYGEFRAPKREKSSRHIKQLICQLCNTPIPSVGMFTHLRDTHNTTPDDYAAQFGEYRPSKLRQTEYVTRLDIMNPEDKQTCLICQQEFASGILLGYHIKNIHHMKKKDYVFKHVFDGVRPLCECGCQRKVKLLGYPPYKVDYVSGHNKPTLGFKFSDESKLKMSSSAIERINTQTFKKTDTKPELEFKAILDELQIPYEHPYTVNLGTRYASVDFHLPEYDMLVEVDGEYWHPHELKNLNFHILPNVISDGQRRVLKNLYRIREFDIPKFKEYAKTKELAIEYLRKNNSEFHPQLPYTQHILAKEYFRECIEKKGQSYLKSFGWLLKKFIHTFQPEFPYPDLEENLQDVIDKVAKSDVQKIYNSEKKEFSDNISVVGHNYLKHYFHSFWKSKFNGNMSPEEAWLDDKTMIDVINYRIGCNNSGEIFDFSLHQLVRGLSARRITISFFKPLLATAIYQHYLGNNQTPVVLDPCCGFGGRLLGFKSKYPMGKYIGCEPNVETYNELIELRNQAKWEDTVEIYNCKFEDFTNDRNDTFDLVFTSIPYYDVEIYSNNTDYKSFEEWKSTFIRSIEKYGRIAPTLINLPEGLATKLGWKNIDSWIASNRSHFDSKPGTKLAPIIRL
jgi:hypothetical protein